MQSCLTSKTPMLPLRGKSSAFAVRVNTLLDQICELLDENAASIAKKISRGTFPATFFLAGLVALELDGIRIEDI